MILASDALAQALDEADEQALERIVKQALIQGELQRNAYGHLVPSGEAALMRESGLQPWGCWRKAGFCPLHVKPASLGPSGRDGLKVISRELRDRCWHQVVPYWVTPTYSISLYLPDAKDLRFVIQQGYIAARRAHATCIASLALFLELDADLRERLRLAGVKPTEYDIAARYGAAIEGVGRAFGTAAAWELAALPWAPLAGSRQMLFLDPKPANYIYGPCADGAGPDLAGDVWRVDLNLMPMLASVTLQVVIVYFSYPTGIEADADFDAAFERRRATAREQAQGFVVDGAEFDVMLRYYLVRKLHGALASGAADKARAFARMLSCLLRSEVVASRVENLLYNLEAPALRQSRNVLSA